MNDCDRPRVRVSDLSREGARRPCYVALLVLLAFLTPASVGAQALPLVSEPTFTPPGVRIPDWHVRFDEPGVSDNAVSFRGMNGGMHVTTGPAAILWKVDPTADIPYTVDAYFLSRVAPTARQTYGIFIGGRNLIGEAPRYTAFVAREDGRFLLESRVGADRHVIVDWTETPAIARPDEKDDLYGRLTIQVARDTVTFLSNDRVVAMQPHSAIETQGLAGLRVLDGADVHIRYFEVYAGTGTP